MKLLWYSDALHFKRHGKSITGLAYSALPMGAVPEGYEEIVLLDGVSFDTALYDENIAYRFRKTPGFQIKLGEDEIASINDIVSELGNLNTPDIIERMHEEDAYKYTPNNSIVSYSFAKTLSVH